MEARLARAARRAAAASKDEDVAPKVSPKMPSFEPLNTTRPLFSAANTPLFPEHQRMIPPTEKSQQYTGHLSDVDTFFSHLLQLIMVDRPDNVISYIHDVCQKQDQALTYGLEHVAGAFVTSLVRGAQQREVEERRAAAAEV